jgi:hypothetical protein
MDACDVLLTSPRHLQHGGGRQRHPIVHTPPIPALKTHNAQFFAERGMSILAPTEDSARKTPSARRDAEQCARMLAASGSISSAARRSALRRIFSKANACGIKSSLLNQNLFLCVRVFAAQGSFCIERFFRIRAFFSQ